MFATGGRIFRRSSAAVTVVSAALLGWLFIEAQGGGALGLAERLADDREIVE